MFKVLTTDDLKANGSRTATSEGGGTGHPSHSRT